MKKGTRMLRKSHFFYIAGGSKTPVSDVPDRVLLSHGRQYSGHRILKESEMLPEEYSPFPAPNVQLHRCRRQRRN